MAEFGGRIGAIELLVLLLILAIILLPYWRILRKMGYSGALGCLVFVPIANLILLLVLAFSEWPIEQELRLLRDQQRRE